MLSWSLLIKKERITYNIVLKCFNLIYMGVWQKQGPIVGVSFSFAGTLLLFATAENQSFGWSLNALKTLKISSLCI